MTGADRMWAEVPGKLLEAFVRMGGLPELLAFRGDRMADWIRPMIYAALIKADRCDRLDLLDEKRKELGAAMKERLPKKTRI